MSHWLWHEGWRGAQFQELIACRSSAFSCHHLLPTLPISGFICTTICKHYTSCNFCYFSKYSHLESFLDFCRPASSSIFSLISETDASLLRSLFHLRLHLHLCFYGFIHPLIKLPLCASLHFLSWLSRSLRLLRKKIPHSSRPKLKLSTGSTRSHPTFPTRIRRIPLMLPLPKLEVRLSRYCLSTTGSTQFDQALRPQAPPPKNGGFSLLEETRPASATALV